MTSYHGNSLEVVNCVTAVARLTPVTSEMRRLMAAPDHIGQVLRQGAERAEAMATDNLARVYDLVGFLPR
jgi:tryptophanyl-tRNA synthetase